MPDTFNKHFLAAVGVEQEMKRVAEGHLQVFYQNLLTEYRKEAQYERARLMRKSPLDYKAVRSMDHELDEIDRQLRSMEMELHFTE
jgi:hypothetical protein